MSTNEAPRNGRCVCASLPRTTTPPGAGSLSLPEAVPDTLGSLHVPVITDVECGRVPPYVPTVNGPPGRLVHTASRRELTRAAAS